MLLGFNKEPVISGAEFTNIGSTDKYCFASTSYNINVHSPKECNTIIENEIPSNDIIQANQSSSNTSV